MIVSAPVVLRPTAPGVAPGAVLPAGPAGATGATGPAGMTGAPGATGPAPAAADLAVAASTAATNLYAGLPTTLPATAGVLWSNGGLPSIS